MVITLHAGHNPDGLPGSGAAGYLLESTAARLVVLEMTRLLRLAGHTVYDITVNDGKNQSDVLRRLVQRAESHTDADFHVSIHLNAGASGAKDGKTTGTEVLLYDADNSKLKMLASSVTAEISKLGYKNRGLKSRPNLYILKHTSKPCMLIECCFVDDPEDAALFDPLTMAAAICKGIGVTPITVPENVSDEPIRGEAIDPAPLSSAGTEVYRVQVGAYRNKEGADRLLSELQKAGFADAFIKKGGV